jgi:beta-galactosidase
MTDLNSNSLFGLGAAYYPDYIEDGALARTSSGEIRPLAWTERIKEDLERMKGAGLSFVRMGEFCWASVEPERDKFQCERFHVALEQCRQRDIDVIFCTPTATPPKWLIDEFPDILPITREGRTIPFGSRRHYDVCNKDYLAEAERITGIFAEQFGSHPSIIGWQVDNEFGCHGSSYSFTAQARSAFQHWLEHKYAADIERLNREWFTAFWSQHYASFSQIELPFSSWADQNPHLELDFRRFSNDAYCKFLGAQVSILRKLSPGRFITHNFMSLFTDLCPWQLSADLDLPGFDHYQMTDLPRPQTSAWQFSLLRSLKDKPFIVLEQQPLQVNWQAVNRRFSYDWLFLWGLQSAFRGAKSMCYFSWQRMYGGAEQYHDGIVPHDLRVPESWQEQVISAKNTFFQLLQEKLALSSMPEAARDVLCVHNFESLWTHEITSQSALYSTHEILDFVSDLCSRAAFGLHFTASLEDCGESLFQYKLLILPGYAFELNQGEKALLRQFLDRGGKVVSLPRTAFKQKNNQMSAKPLDLFADDFYFEDYGALGDNEVEIIVTADETIKGIRWVERIRLVSSDWIVVAKFKQGLYDGAPAAISNNSFKNGGIYMHLAFCPESTAQAINWLLKSLSMDVLAEQNSSRPIQLLPLVSGARHFLSAINFEDEAQSIKLTRAYKSLLVAGLDQEQRLQISDHHTEDSSQALVKNLAKEPGQDQRGWPCEIELPGRHVFFAELAPISQSIQESGQGSGQQSDV